MCPAPEQRVPASFGAPRGRTDVVFELRGSEMLQNHPAFFWRARILLPGSSKNQEPYRNQEILLLEEWCPNPPPTYYLATT